MLITTFVCLVSQYPKGIMSEVLRFSRTLLQQIKQPLLPHVSVYGPMTVRLRSASPVHSNIQY